MSPERNESRFSNDRGDAGRRWLRLASRSSKLETRKGVGMGSLLVHITHGPEAPTRAALGVLAAEGRGGEGERDGECENTDEKSGEVGRSGLD